LVFANRFEPGAGDLEEVIAEDLRSLVGGRRGIGGEHDDRIRLSVGDQAKR